MKHLKMLGLLVMAAASLMAFAGSASAAPVLTSPAGTDYTGTIHATLEESALLKAGIEVTCTESTAHGIVSVNNTTHAEGALSTELTKESTQPTGLHFGGCNAHVNVINPGSLTIDDKGTVFSKNARVEIVKTGIATCFYGTESTPISIGDLTPGTPATLDISTTHLKRLAGSNIFFCASEGTWSGKYKVTTPGTLLLT